MAKQTVVVLSDDIDGREGDVETVTFALDGVTYEIDLHTKNAARLRKSLDPFVLKGRKVKRTRRRQSR